MKIKDLKLIPPSKRTTVFFINFMREHDKGLKAIKTLAEIKEIIEPMVKNGYFVVNEIMGDFEKILQKINEVEDVESN